MLTVRRLGGFVVAALVASSLMVVTGPGPAYAASGPGAGFVWASNPTPPSPSTYTPPANYQYNSTSPFAAINTVTWMGTGRYRVTFTGLATRGVSHVTAYGGDNVICAPAGSVTTDLMVLEVECVNPAGDLVNHTFTASYTNVKQSWQGRPMAYAFVDPFRGVLDPLTGQYNSTGATNTLIYNGVGDYVLRLPGLGGSAAGHVQVSAWWGFNRGERCKVAVWWSEGTDKLIRVLCFKNGLPADSYVELTYVDGLNILGLSSAFTPDGHASAYAWANDPVSAGYTPSTFYQYYNNTTTAVTASWTGAGAYTVQIAGANLGNGNVQVTAYGLGPEYCNVAGWNASGIRVRCFTYDGFPADTRFDVAFTGPFVIG